eukprot:14390070-Alexandrium_andersonii.AAC.1
MRGAASRISALGFPCGVPPGPSWRRVLSRGRGLGLPAGLELALAPRRGQPGPHACLQRSRAAAAHPSVP